MATNFRETAIRENFDGMHLKKECLNTVMEEYGPDRMDWVLANTVRHLEYDGRFQAVPLPPPSHAASG